MFGKAKDYISLKEAAKISGYHSDYIGYLIRKKKIKSRKVFGSSAWFVNIKELLAYKNKQQEKRRNLSYRIFNLLKFRQPFSLQPKGLDQIGTKVRYDSTLLKKGLDRRKDRQGAERVPIRIYDIFPPFREKVSVWVKSFNLFLKTSKYATALIFLIIIICGGLIVWALPPQAPIAKIYPAQCQGGWENPQNA